MHGVEHQPVDGLRDESGLVGADRFGDLRADAHDRVQRGHGLLEDHGDVAAAAAAHFALGQGEQIGRDVFAGVTGRGEQDFSGDVCGVGKQPQHGQRGRRFA